MKIWEMLDKKGRIATIIGFCFAAPINGKVIFDFFKGNIATVESLYSAIFINVIAIIWFILPSSIKIKGSKFELEVID